MSDPSLEAACARLRLEVTDLGVADELGPQEQHQLARLLDDAIERRDRQLREAVDASLGAVPRPLRKVVARVVRR